MFYKLTKFGYFLLLIGEIESIQKIRAIEKFNIHRNRRGQRNVWTNNASFHLFSQRRGAHSGR